MWGMSGEDALATAAIMGLAIWLIVRIANRREIWAILALALLGVLAVLGVLARWLDWGYGAV